MSDCAPLDETTARLAVLDDDEVASLDAWWRADNYLTVGQIYLMANPLLREPLTAEHIKPRLLGHWGTSPGLSFVYAHVSRLSARPVRSCSTSRAWGTAARRWWPPATSRDLHRDLPRGHPGRRGDAAAVPQFSALGGIPSHVSVTTPGLIHEGGELGYVLVHAFGAVMDNPDLAALAVVGDGEADRPARGLVEGHLLPQPLRGTARCCPSSTNGAKIAGPTVLGRKDPAEVRSLLEGTGTTSSRSRG